MKTGRLKIITQRDGARGHGRRRPAWPRASPTSTSRPARDNHVRARIVVLAASACESARILLNSKSSKFPQGLANSSGVVGSYLTDLDRRSSVTRVHSGADGQHPAQRRRHRRHALYTPWWLDNKKLDFPRGYHIELERRPPDAERAASAAASTTSRAIDAPGAPSRSAATANS